MSRQMILIIKDIMRNIGKVLQLMIQLMVGTFFFLFILTQLQTTINQLNLFQKMKEKEIIQFDLDEGITNLYINEKIGSKIEQWMDVEHKAYTSIHTYKIEEYPEYNVVIGVGNFNKVFEIEPGDLDVYTMPQVILGRNIRELGIGDSIGVGKIKKVECKVISILPSEKKCLVGSDLQSLNNSVIILMSKDEYDELFGEYYLDEFIFNLGFTKASKSEIISYINGMGDSGIKLYPVIMNNLLMKYKQSYIKNDIAFFMFYVVTMFFILCSVFVNVVELQQKNKREYSIHLLYGANRKQIYFRIISYIIIVVGVPIISSILYLSYLEGKLIGSYISIIIGLAVVIFSISIYPIQMVKNKKEIELTRRE